MDEPLGALDKKLRAHMQLELKRIQRHLHVTVIYVTHDQEEALTMSDRVAVMRGGRTEQIGTPAELYESPVSPFVADFVGESNFLDGVVVSTSPDGRAVVRAEGGLELHGVSREPLQVGERAVAAVRPEKIVPQEPRASELNRCKGVVDQVVYAGDATRYSVALGAAGTLTVKVQNRLASRQVATGDLVELAWDAGDTRLFARAPDER
jgi:ABC-type Fe3+/spermidine/putrescine transport system ATPase subunit